MNPPPLVVVVVGGARSGVDRGRFRVPDGSVVVAADSGLDAATHAGLRVHHVVGDLDSVDPDLLAAAEAAGAVVHRHPADKDQTDGALALDLALDLLGVGAGVAPAPRSQVRPTLLVLGGGDGRLDHLLADVLALAGPTLAPVDVTARFGPATLTVVRVGARRTVDGSVGEQISLLPVHGTARGVTTTGLRWALDDADLAAGTTRAMSNEMVAGAATVEVGSGVVVVVQPGTMAPPVEARSTPYDPRPVEPSAPPADTGP